MFKLAKKWWKYLTAKLTGSFEANADPKIQLEQAITEAQEQHKRLKEQATAVIAGQKQAEIRLNGKLAELEKLNANARQALIMAADAEKAGDADKAAKYTSAAETIAVADGFATAHRGWRARPLVDGRWAPWGSGGILLPQVAGTDGMACFAWTRPEEDA